MSRALYKYELDTWKVPDFIRGTPALHLNEPTWIIDRFNELIVDFLFALVIFLDSTQPQPLKVENESIFWIKQTNVM